MAKNIVKRLTEQLQAKGMSKGMANAVASKKMTEAGNTTKAGKLTKKGKKRTEMGAAGRAKDRAAKTAGKEVKDFKYSSKTNRATLKKK